MRQITRQATHQVSRQRVIAALRTLSRLALRTSVLAQGSAEQWARLLLKQLLALCEAQQGALFLAREEGPRKKEPAVWSAFARLHWKEAEAEAAFSSFALMPDLLQGSPTAPVTLCWKRILPSPPALRDEPDHARSETLSSCTVALLLRWSEGEPDEQEAAQQQALQLLPILADLVDTILQHILSAHVEEEPLAEVLPAELLATIGHELRGPLTTIQGYAQTLLRHEQRLTREERQEFLRAISQASAHVSTLVNRFLELAQFETQTHAFLPTAVNMQALAQESITAAQERGSHRLLLLPVQQTAEAGFEGARGDELTISGDRRSLRTMLDMLLENALLYSAPESLVEIFLAAKTFAASSALLPLATSTRPLALILPATFREQESVLEIRVRDHGRGIAPDELSAIFRRFYRGDSRLTREVNGLGLGLALCKAIVAQHRGMLWVESVLGEGSTFHILLPHGSDSSQ